MTPAFPLKSAAELMDASFDARWLDRARIGPARGPPCASSSTASSPRRPGGIGALGSDAAVAELDERDLIYISDGRVMLAYPFAGRPRFRHRPARRARAVGLLRHRRARSRHSCGSR
jgi:hypothetical protein